MMTDIRQSSIKLLVSSLEKANEDVSSTNAVPVAEQLEQAVFAEHNGETGNAYRDHVRTLSLDVGKNNVQLAQDLLNGRIDAKTLLGLGPDGTKSTRRAKEDEELQEQNLRDSIGTHKVPVYETDEKPSQHTTLSELAQQGELGPQAESMGEEGDFKQRTQPKIHGLEGIEFESGM